MVLYGVSGNKLKKDFLEFCFNNPTLLLEYKKNQLQNSTDANFNLYFSVFVETFTNLVKIIFFRTISKAGQ